MSRHADRGKWAEKQATDWLLARATQRLEFAFHRLPDARAARGALAAQPCDFLVAPGDGRTTYLEVKDTAEQRRLPRAKISQYSKLKMFFWAKCPVRVLVYRSAFNDWVVLDEDHLFATDDAPASFVIAGLTPYYTVGEALSAIFGP